MVIQSIHDISEICALKGIKNAVLSPGSRCAPLTISFARNQNIKCWTFSDERSAAFQAIGMTQTTKSPTVLVCTSGSAAYNYAPAVAEAFYQEIPLLILTADRPSEWIDQKDGQTIRQTNIYGSHVKKSFQLPDYPSSEDSYWYINRVINEAINCSLEYPRGPVHVNVPLREPFYPEKDEEIEFSEEVRIIEPSNSIGYADFLENNSLSSYSKILLVIGQSDFDEGLIKFLNDSKHPYAIIGDIISNTQLAEDCIIHQDIFLNNVPQNLSESLKPELLITFGKSVISKNLKLFLRENKPLQHWHIQEAGDVSDTFQSLTNIIRANPISTLKEIEKSIQTTKNDFLDQKRNNYIQSWKLLDKKSEEIIFNSLNKGSFSEMTAINQVLARIPENSAIHLANSMSVRYANFIGLKGKKIEIFANRGTSGIDGSNSTAYGNALTNNSITTLITGDMAFFYDRNAFWNNYNPNKLRIIMINNNGGGIFKMIKGPKDQPELEEFFVTKQSLSARKLSEENGFIYFQAQNENELTQILTSFYIPSESPKILELKTNPDKDIDLLKKIREAIH